MFKNLSIDTLRELRKNFIVEKSILERELKLLKKKLNEIDKLLKDGK